MNIIDMLDFDYCYSHIVSQYPLENARVLAARTYHRKYTVDHSQELQEWGERLLAYFRNMRAVTGEYFPVLSKCLYMVGDYALSEAEYERAQRFMQQRNEREFVIANDTFMELIRNPDQKSLRKIHESGMRPIIYKYSSEDQWSSVSDGSFAAENALMSQVETMHLVGASGTWAVYQDPNGGAREFPGAIVPFRIGVCTADVLSEFAAVFGLTDENRCHRVELEGKMVEISQYVPGRYRKDCIEDL